MEFLSRKCWMKRQPYIASSVGREEQQGHVIQAEESETECLGRKAGYVSIEDRVRCLAERQHGQENKTSLQKSDVRGTPQYANLYELFSSKTGRTGTGADKTHSSSTNLCHEPRKAHIPVMKLSKDDWNVKCWEERLNPHRLREPDVSPDTGGSIKKASKSCGQRVEVFKGRIEDVAAKLDKVREGYPMDHKLFELKTNRSRETKNSHDWTDMLKKELENGIHNPRMMNSEIAQLGSSSDQQSDKSFHAFRKTRVGRPIRRMFLDDEDEDQ